MAAFPDLGMLLRFRTKLNLGMCENGKIRNGSEKLSPVSAGAWGDLRLKFYGFMVCSGSIKYGTICLFLK